MTRSRVLNISLNAAKARRVAVETALAEAQHHGATAVVENKGQAMPKGAIAAARGSRADRKVRAKAAGLELMAADRMTLDVSRLHPRWLRAVVSDMLDAGAQITPTEVEVLRAHGPEGARMVADTWAEFKT